VRLDPGLRSRYQAILGHLGLLLVLAGAAMLTPLVALAAWPDESKYALSFVFPALLTGGTGFWLRRQYRPRPHLSLSVAEGGIVLVLAWVLVCVASALPLMASLGLNFTQGVFESVSGWTTTGLSVVDVTKAPNIALLWRSIMQLLGGAGMAIVLITAGGGPMGPGFAAAEGRGDQLVPHVRRSARLVAVIYAGYAVVGTVAYVLTGMSFFDAVNHSFAAVSTGGFSTRPESIGAWDSPAVEAVTVALMLLGSFHFQTVHLALSWRWRAVTHNAEMRTTATLLSVAAAITFVVLASTIYPALDRAARSAVFETASALTTTGFSLTPYTAWPASAVFVLIVLMLVGGHTGSTAGGIKQFRAYFFLLNVRWELKRLLAPRSAVVVRDVWQGKAAQPLQASHFFDLTAVVALYGLCLAAGVLVLLLHGIPLQDAVFEMTSSLSTVGLSIGVTSPHSPTLVLWTETLGMFLGRLEFLVVVAAIGRVIRDTRGLVRR
jgi:trk system potassium uptake protein